MPLSEPACPFYGCDAVPVLKLLIAREGNRCALVTHEYLPCRMEKAGEIPNLVTCELRTLDRARRFAGFARDNAGIEGQQP